MGKEIILINYDDVDKTQSIVENNVITKIELKEDTKAYEFSTFGKSLDEAGATFVKGTYRNTWQHTLPLRIFVKHEDAKAFVNNFAAGTKIIAIVKNKEIGEANTAEGRIAGAVKYEAYGWDNGLELNESTNTVAMADGVVYSLTLGTSETAQEGSLPKSVFATKNNESTPSLSATEEMLSSLVVERTNP